MAVHVVTSVSGAPGATTIAVALAHRWRDVTGREALLAEADPDGGVIAARHGLPLEPGLVELAGSARLGIAPAEVVERAQRFTSGVPVVPAHPSAARTTAALRAAAAHLGRAFADLPDVDVVVDIGRLRADSPALALVDSANSLTLAVHPTAEDVVVALHRMELIARVPVVRVVSVGSAPYRSHEVASVLGVDAVLDVPFDPTAVRSDPAARRRRRTRPTAWSAAIAALVEALSTAASEQVPA